MRVAFARSSHEVPNKAAVWKPVARHTYDAKPTTHSTRPELACLLHGPFMDRCWAVYPAFGGFGRDRPRGLRYGGPWRGPRGCSVRLVGRPRQGAACDQRHCTTI